MTPLRFAVLDHVLERGGAQLAIARLADALRHEAAPLFVLPGEGPFADRLRGSGHPVEVVPLGEARTVRIESVDPLTDILRNGPELAAATSRMASVVRAYGAELVYTNSLKAHVYGAVVARRARLPHVMHVRDILAPPYLPLKLRHSLRVLFAVLPPTALVANSRPTAKAAPVRARAVVIPSGITREPRMAPPRSGSDPVLAVLGRIERWKGQDVAIRALARLRRSLSGARLVIGGGLEVGEQRYGDELRELCSLLGVEEAVEFTGFVDDPYAFFERANVALHTSILPEPFGQVVVEAMATGRPVVATAAGGPLDILQLGRSGVLVPPGDPDALAEAAGRILGEPDLYERLSRLGAERARDYTIEASAERTLALLGEVVRR